MMAAVRRLCKPVSGNVRTKMGSGHKAAHHRNYLLPLAPNKHLGS